MAQRTKSKTVNNPYFSWHQFQLETPCICLADGSKLGLSINSLDVDFGLSPKVSLQPLGELFEFGCELFVLLFLVCVASVRGSSVRILRLLHGPIFHKEQHGCSFAARRIVRKIGHTAESQREFNLTGIVVKRKFTCFVKVP